jgi:hypothetical protein
MSIYLKQSLVMHRMRDLLSLTATGAMRRCDFWCFRCGVTRYRVANKQLGRVDGYLLSE